MTSFDFLFLLFLVAFAVAGVYTGGWLGGACLIGGFLGSAFADVYAPALASYMGGSVPILFLVRIVIVVVIAAILAIPSFFVGKLSTMILLGFLNRAGGLLAGLVAGFFIVSFTLMSLVPKTPKIRKSDSFQSSTIVKPLQEKLELVFMSRSPIIMGDLAENIHPRSFFSHFSSSIKSLGHSIKNLFKR